MIIISAVEYDALIKMMHEPLRPTPKLRALLAVYRADHVKVSASPESDDTSPEVPVTDLPDDVPNGDIGATEPEEPQ